MKKTQRMRRPYSGEVYKICPSQGNLEYVLVIAASKNGHYFIGSYFCAGSAKSWDELRLCKPVLTSETYSNSIEDGTWSFVCEDQSHPLVVAGVPLFIRHTPPPDYIPEFQLISLLEEDGSFQGWTETVLRVATPEEAATLPRTGCAREGWIETRLDSLCSKGGESE